MKKEAAAPPAKTRKNTPFRVFTDRLKANLAADFSQWG
jgi:hypothetical protein